MKFKFNNEQLKELEIVLCHKMYSTQEAVNVAGEKLGFTTFQKVIEKIEKMVDDNIERTNILCL